MAGTIEEQNFSFYFNYFKFSHTWLMANILDSAALNNSRQTDFNTRVKK